MADGKEPFGYLAFRLGGEKRPSSFLVTFDAKRVATWRSEHDNVDAGREEDAPREPEHVSPNDQSGSGSIETKNPKDLFERFLNAMQ